MLTSLITALRAGCSASLTVLGDDSLNGGDEPVKLLGPLFTQYVQDMQARYRYWDNSNGRYAPQFDEDIWGNRTRAARRRIKFNQSRPRVRAQAQMPGITGDFDIAGLIAPDTTWVVASNQQVLAMWGGQASASGTGRALMFGLKANSTNYALLQLSISTDGSNQIDITSTAPIPTPSPLPQTPQPTWVRVTRVASTGVVTFYTSTDGTTWTQLGATVTSTTGNLYASTEVWTLGGRGTNTELFLGSIYGLRVKNSLSATAPLINTGPIESWVSRSDTSDTTTRQGSPTLTLHNGSFNGATIKGTYADPVKVAQMVEKHETALVGILGGGINDNALWAGGADHKAALDVVLANVRAANPDATPFVINGHPFIAPRTALRADPQATRAAITMAWAQKVGIPCIDTYSAFTGVGGQPIESLVSGTASSSGSKNGSDLLPAGSALYARTIMNALLP